MSNLSSPRGFTSQNTELIATTASLERLLHVSDPSLVQDRRCSGRHRWHTCNKEYWPTGTLHELQRTASVVEFDENIAEAEAVAYSMGQSNIEDDQTDK